MYKTHILKTTKYYWKNLKILINGEIFHIDGVENSRLLRWQFSPNWAICSIKSLSKSQQDIFQTKLKSLFPLISKLTIQYKSTIINTAWYQFKDRHNGVWNRTEIPEIYPHNIINLFFIKLLRKIVGKW